MIVEISTAATASVALLHFLLKIRRMRLFAPPVRVLHVRRYGEFAVAMIRVHPAAHDVRIDRICCKYGIAEAPSWHGVEDYAVLLREVVHVRSLPVSIELLPASLNPSGYFRLNLSIALKKSPRCVKLVFKKSNSFFATQTKTKVQISRDTE